MPTHWWEMKCLKGYPVARKSGLQQVYDLLCTKELFVCVFYSKKELFGFIHADLAELLFQVNY